MKTTVELSYKELCLICDMAKEYYDKTQSQITVYKNMNDLYDEIEIKTDEFLKLWERREKETMELWEKMEKAQKNALYGEVK